MVLSLISWGTLVTLHVVQDACRSNYMFISFWSSTNCQWFFTGKHLCGRYFIWTKLCFFKDVYFTNRWFASFLCYLQIFVIQWVNMFHNHEYWKFCFLLSKLVCLEFCEAEQVFGFYLLILWYGPSWWHLSFHMWNSHVSNVVKLLIKAFTRA